MLQGGEGLTRADLLGGQNTDPQGPESRVPKYGASRVSISGTIIMVKHDPQGSKYTQKSIYIYIHSFSVRSRNYGVGYMLHICVLGPLGKQQALALMLLTCWKETDRSQIPRMLIGPNMFHLFFFKGLQKTDPKYLGC